MQTFTLRRVLGLLAAMGSAVGFLLMAPSTIGGSATWVTTSGISMEPGITQGDLVIARPQSDYQVGDAVAYPSAALDGTVVLHRIVAEEGEGFVTQGDNNDWLDPDRPQASEILGAMWLHIPGGGRVINVLADPFVIAALVLTLLTAGALFTTKRARRRGSRRAEGGTSAAPRVPAEWPVGQWAAYAAVAAIGLGFFSFSRPVDTTTTEPVDLSHVAELGYTADAAEAADLYEGGRIRTGDPVFLSVATVVDSTLNYTLQAAEGTAEITGTITSTAEVTAGNGWSRSVPFGSPQEFTGTEVQQSVTVDFPELVKVVERAEEQAGAEFGGRTVTVAHQVHVTGEVDGEPVDTTYTPSLSFTVDGVQATLRDPEGLSAQDGTVTLTETESVTTPGTATATVTVLRWDVPVSTLRLLSLALGGAALALAALAWHRHPITGPSRQPRFGKRLVQASHVDLTDRSVVDVDDADALLRLATMYDTVVLELSHPGQSLYLVVADNTVYRYAQAAATPGSRAERRHRESAGTPHA